MKQRLTKQQRQAVNAYEFCLREEDRLGGSVFANSHNVRLQEAKTRIAYDNAKRLGVSRFC
jgi:hypothetical protein